MDGFSEFKTAAAEELPDATPVMDPFHVVRLAGDALDRTRQRVQQDTLGYRGHAGDPLHKARRTLHTGASFLTEKQTARLQAVFAVEEHIEVEATWGIYQRIVAAYREPDKNKAKEQMRAVIDSVTSGVPAALTEIRRLGRTLRQRAADVLAFFDRPGTSNGPTEALECRRRHSMAYAEVWVMPTVRVLWLISVVGGWVLSA
jgi:transposase